MITLEIEDYCQDCPHFEVEQNSFSAINVYGEEVLCEHAITCKNLKLCERLRKHLLNKGETSNV